MQQIHLIESRVWSGDDVAAFFVEEGETTYFQGSLRFLRDKAICEPPFEVTHEAYGARYPFAWLADGRAFLIDADEQVWVGKPCGDFERVEAIDSVYEVQSVGPARERLLLGVTSGPPILYDVTTGNTITLPQQEGIWYAAPSWSPDGRYLVETRWQQITDEEGRVTEEVGTLHIIETATGALVNRFDINPSGGKGWWPAPGWLNEQQFALPADTERGPLLISISGEVKPLVDVFGLEADEVCREVTTGPCSNLAGYAAPGVLVLADQNSTYIRTEAGIEGPLAGFVSLSPDGRWITIGNYESSNYLYELRSTAPNSEGLTLRAETPPVWAGDYALVGGVNQLLTVHLPTLDVVREWDVPLDYGHGAANDAQALYITYEERSTNPEQPSSGPMYRLYLVELP
jgi:hypothetical protein